MRLKDKFIIKSITLNDGTEMFEVSDKQFKKLKYQSITAATIIDIETKEEFTAVFATEH